MAWTDQLDLYCERLDTSLWAEPANALSNLSFLIAAFALWQVAAAAKARGDVLPGAIRSLPPLVLVVGIGSIAFHTLATRWAALLDTLFILLFCCVFLFAFLRHAVRWRWWMALLCSVIFALVSYSFPRLFAQGTLNGSIGYLPYLGALLAMTFFLAHRHAPSAHTFGLACAVFCVSLTLRTVDLDICPRFALGTHFLWHLLNGFLLWLVSRELILRRYVPPQVAAARA